MEQPSESDPQFVHFQHWCPTLNREEQVILFHALRNQGTTFASNGMVTITNSAINGPVAGINFGTMQSIIQMLPEPIDPLPVALATLASIPLDHVPAPRSDLPQASRLPFEASPHFVGREMELKALAQAIGTAQPAVVMPAVATGLGGIGKTSLVTEFAYRYGVYFHGGVFWLNCADPDQVSSQIAACAVGLKLDTTGMSLDEQVQRVLHAWQSPMPRLLIFDNCEDRAILDQWKPTVGGCRVLVTARSDQWPTLTQLRLGLLSPGESRLLLQRLCARLSDGEADAIAEDLGHLPLALHLAGSYLNTYSHHTAEQYRKDLTIAHQSLKGRGALPSPTRHEQDVEATFMLSFNQLDPTDALDVLALGMLDGAAWCAPGVPIPRDLVLAFVPDETDDDDAVDALRRLQKLGLLDGIDAVVLHRLVGLAIHARLGDHTHAERVVTRWDAQIGQRYGWAYVVMMWGAASHLRHLSSVMRGWGDPWVAICARHMAEYADVMNGDVLAEEWYRQCLQAEQRAFGVVHAQVAATMNDLAEICVRQGKTQAALAYGQQAYQIHHQLFGDQHETTAFYALRVGYFLQQHGLAQQAPSWYAQTLTILSQHDHAEDRDVGLILEATLALVTLLQRTGQADAARQVYDRSLQILQPYAITKEMDAYWDGWQALQETMQSHRTQ